MPQTSQNRTAILDSPTAVNPCKLYNAHNAHNVPQSMPRISERSRALQDIDAALEIAAWEYALLPLMDESTPIQGYIQDLILMHDVISSTRYLFKGLKGSAGRHAGDSLEAYIHEYPDTSFLHLFRMHRESFWQLVQLLTQAGGTSATTKCASGASGCVGRTGRSGAKFSKIALPDRRPNIHTRLGGTVPPTSPQTHLPFPPCC